jgi:hypothetical protein
LAPQCSAGVDQSRRSHLVADRAVLKLLKLLHCRLKTDAGLRVRFKEEVVVDKLVRAIVSVVFRCWRSC